MSSTPQTMAGQFLTDVEMSGAVTNRFDPHYLTDEQLRLAMAHLIVTAPAETAAAICEQQATS